MDDSILAKLFALSSDDVQAEFLNQAGRMLRRACHESPGGWEMQAAMIVDHLDADGREFIGRLNGFIESDHEPRT